MKDKTITADEATSAAGYLDEAGYCLREYAHFHGEENIKRATAQLTVGAEILGFDLIPRKEP